MSTTRAVAVVALAGTLLVVTASVAARPTAPAKAIAFESNRTGDFDIYVTTPDGKPKVDLTPRSRGNDSAPDFSPDGRRIAFTSDRFGRYAIWLMNADGTGQRRLTKPRGIDVNPTWSPNGRQIAFTGTDRVQWDVYLTTPNGGRRQLTNDRANEVDVSWSPKGDQVVYDRIEHGTSDLWVQKVARGAPQQLTRTPGLAELNPSWSPDGSSIAFDASDKKGAFHIHVVDASGRKLRQVTKGSPDDSDPSWSPDSKQILFTRTVGRDFEVFIVNADGSGLRNLSRDSSGLDVGANWGRSQARVATRMGAGTASGAAPVFGCDAAYTGDGMPNTINGDGATNKMCGKGANDKLNGGGGSDYMNGNNDADTLHGNDGKDYMKGRPETVVVKDYIYGDGASDTAWVDQKDYVSAETYCRL